MPVPRLQSPFIPHVAEVQRGGHIDSSKKGTLQVKLLGAVGTSDETITAHSLMPFGGRGHGVFGPVEPHTKVLVVPVLTDPLDDSKGCTWYWVGVIPTIDYVRKEKYEEEKPTEPHIAVRSTIPESERVYNLDEVPTKTILKNMVGHKLELAETVLSDSNKEIIQEDYIQMATNSNKFIKIDDGIGKGYDRIEISDNKDNRIVIKTGDDDDADPGWGPESITIECTGNTHVLSKAGEMDIRVGPDSTSNITIQNNGTGDIVCQCDQGNTYVLAEKDIYVESTNLRVTETSSIYVDAGVDVNIVAGNNTNVTTGADTTVTTTGNTTVTTEGDLKIDTTGTTDITSDGDMTLSAPNITIDADNTVDVNGPAGISLN